MKASIFADFLHCVSKIRSFRSGWAVCKRIESRSIAFTTRTLFNLLKYFVSYDSETYGRVRHFDKIRVDLHKQRQRWREIKWNFRFYYGAVFFSLSKINEPLVEGDGKMSGFHDKLNEFDETLAVSNQWVYNSLPFNDGCSKEGVVFNLNQHNEMWCSALLLIFSPKTEEGLEEFPWLCVQMEKKLFTKTINGIDVRPTAKPYHPANERPPS